MEGVEVAMVDVEIEGLSFGGSGEGNIGKELGADGLIIELRGAGGTINTGEGFDVDGLTD